MQNIRIIISSTLAVYSIIGMFVLYITALLIISPDIIHVSKGTITFLRNSSRSMDLGFWYNRLLLLPYIFLHVTPSSGKYVLSNQWKVLLSHLYLNTDAAGTSKRRYPSTNLNGVMSQGIEIFVLKHIKFSWYKTAGHCWCDMKNRRHLHDYRIYTQNLFHCQQKFCTQSRISDKRDIDSSIHNITHLWRTRTLQNTWFKTKWQKQFVYSVITDNNDLYPFNHLLRLSPWKISKYKLQSLF